MCRVEDIKLLSSLLVCDNVSNFFHFYSTFSSDGELYGSCNGSRPATASGDAWTSNLGRQSHKYWGSQHHLQGPGPHLCVGWHQMTRWKDLLKLYQCHYFEFYRSCKTIRVNSGSWGPLSLLRIITKFLYTLSRRWRSPVSIQSFTTGRSGTRRTLGKG